MKDVLLYHLLRSDARTFITPRWKTASECFPFIVKGLLRQGINGGIVLDAFSRLDGLSRPGWQYGVDVFQDISNIKKMRAGYRDNHMLQCK